MFDLSRQISELYSNLRKSAEDKADYYNSIANNNFNYKKITKQIIEISLELSKAEFKNDLKNITSLKSQKNLLLEKQDNILKNLGLNKNKLNPNFLCKKCNDTGLANGKVCDCYKKYYSKIFMENFNFDLDNLHKFSDSKIDKYNEKDFEIIKKYCEHFPNSKTKNLTFLGKTGTGKTFITECIASDLLDKNFNVILITAFNLATMLKEYHYSFSKSSSELIKIINDSDLLIIDDLGSEPIIKNITLEYFLSILNERQSLNKHTMFTTNLSKDEILMKYNDRFFARLTDKEISLILELNYPNYRLKNN